MLSKPVSPENFELTNLQKKVEGKVKIRAKQAKSNHN